MMRLGFGVDDQVVMAFSHLGFLNVALRAHARYRARVGSERRSTMTCLYVLYHQDVAAWFQPRGDRVGRDGTSSRAAASLAERGVRSHLAASRRGSLAAVLARAAQDVVYLDLPRAAAA